tara:strand:- start:417 stop:548 length:132 start_codon:yes stop_codon:yes gene_type:complete
MLPTHIVLTLNFNLGDNFFKLLNKNVKKVNGRRIIEIKLTVSR